MNQDTETLFANFTTVIKDLIDVTGNIAQIEESKAQAASQKRHELMDGYIQKEQALILKLRGLDKHRTQLAKSLGWDSLTFRQILNQVSSEQNQILEPLFHELESRLSRLQSSRQAAEKIINVRIHELQTAIAQKGGGSSYDNSGNVSLGAPRPSKMRDTYV